ncbi:MAG: hypothetical protein E7Z85_04660 [Methanosphaera stadtmanae]|nr:hypothetical protein [Methanosphaera stadtmanae]
MIQLIINDKDNTVYTTWILKINKDSRKIKNKNGQEKIYYSYFTSFPQELYEFLEIKEDYVYLVKEYNEDYEIILTDTAPTLPIISIKSKLITRRKNHNKNNRIPTTSFTLPKKIFNNMEEYKEVKFTLHPRLKDKYRNKLGIISIKLIK